ncbi:MAG: hypothetical protein JOZ41_00225, partial [Chloroflexi bacterium]|nr:hypothetical protein [Chloroflexota bacterium]
MDDELVLLTSYFNVAGGRRQDTADTFRVEPGVTSATSPDGSAALYIVTEASTSGAIGPRARRRAADVVIWEYSSHGDDPPVPRLKAALRAAHEAILGEFDGHVTVGLSVMAVEKDTVYLGQVAPAQVYVLHDGNLHSIAAGGGSSPFSRALGSADGVEVAVFRDQIGSEDVISLCSSWFHRGVEPDELRDCFAGESADDIAEGLLELTRGHDVREATGIVVEAIPAREVEAALAESAPPSFMEQVDEAVQALTNVGRILWGELRPAPPPEESDGHHSPAAEAAPKQATSGRFPRPWRRRPEGAAVKEDLESGAPPARQPERAGPAAPPPP